MRLNNLNYLQNKTSRLEHHIRRTYSKCKNKITMFKDIRSSSLVSQEETHVRRIKKGLCVPRCHVSQHGVTYFTWSCATIARGMRKQFHSLLEFINEPSGTLSIRPPSDICLSMASLE